MWVGFQIGVCRCLARFRFVGNKAYPYAGFTPFRAGSSLFWKSEPKSTRGSTPGPLTAALKGSARKLQVCCKCRLLQLLDGRRVKTLIGAGGPIETDHYSYLRQSTKDQRFSGVCLASQSSASAEAESNPIIFPGNRIFGKNSSRGANVRAKRVR